MIDCTVCAAGKYSTTEGRTTACDICSAGKYNDDTAQNADQHDALADCTVCAAGKYSTTEGRTTACDICSAGKYSTETARTADCDVCAQGKYGDETGADSCKPCGIGTHNTNEESNASTACSVCPAGKYNDVNTGLANCKDCATGKRAKDDGSDGSVTGAQSSDAGCQNCVAGRFINSAGSTLKLCTICAANTFQGSPGQTSCSTCSGGGTDCIFVSDSTGCRTCGGCAAGEWGEKGNTNNACKPCVKGKYAGAGDKPVSDCQNCPSGYHGRDLERQETCEICITGKWSSNEGTAAAANSTCTACAGGKYSIAAPGVSEADCELCSGGKYGDSVGADHPSKCKPCEPGTFANDGGRSVICTACVPGQYSNLRGVARSSCTLCPVGKYQKEEGGDACDKCLPGEYQENQGQEMCGDCSLGKYADADGLSNCKDCPAGFSQSSSKSASCLPCNPGKYQDETAAAACITCSAGTYSTASSLLSCQQCAVGKSQKDSGRTSCIQCNPGFYQNSAGSSKCKYCPPKHYQTETEQTQCIPVSDGYIGGQGRTAEIKVAEGWKKECEKGGTCTTQKCERGTYGMEDRTACHDCPDGLSSPAGAMGKEKCTACSKGRFFTKNSKGKGVCKPCLSGLYQDELGSLQCKDCPQGYDRNNSIGSSSCVDRNWWLAENCNEKDEYLNESYVLNDPLATCETSRQYKVNVDLTTVHCTKCEACPVGALCNQESTDSNSIGTKRGFWRIPTCTEEPENQLCETPSLSNSLLVKAGDGITEQSLFQTCPFKSRCAAVNAKDGINTNNSSSSNSSNFVRQCTEGTDLTFPLCAVCLPGWQKSGVGPCVQCTASNHAVQTIAVFGILVFIVIFIMILKTKMKRQLRRVKSLYLDVLRIMSITISFYQIATSLTTTAPTVPWPQDLVKYYDAFQFINIDVLDMAGIACGTRVTHADKLYFSSVTIFALIFAGIGTYMFISFKQESALQSAIKNGELLQVWKIALEKGFDLIDNDESNSVDAVELAELLQIVHSHEHEQDAKALARQFGEGKSGKMKRARDESNGLILASGKGGTMSRAQFIESMLTHPVFNSSEEQQVNLVRWTNHVAAYTGSMGSPAQLAFIFHAPISKTAFQWLNCRWVGTRAYVQADFGTECYTEAYNRTTVLAILVILLFSLGLPLLLGVCLYRSRETLHTPRVKARIGWLYSRNNVGCEWWQLHELARKLLLCSVLMFVSPNALRMPVAVIICIVAIVNLNFFQPQRNKYVFKVEEIAFCSSAIQMICGLSLKAAEGNEEWSNSVGIMMVVLDVLTLLAVVAAVLLLLIFLKSKIAAVDNHHKVLASKRCRSTKVEHVDGDGDGEISLEVIKN